MSNVSGLFFYRVLVDNFFNTMSAAKSMSVHNYKYLFLLPLIAAISLNAGLAKDDSEKAISQNNELHAKPSIALFEKLIRVPRGITVHQFSSHNKKGFNDDEYWPLYVDNNNNEEVIFDAKGPGCIRSMWATNLDSAAIIKFYFDDAKKTSYSLNYIDFYNGRNEDFPGPLVSYTKRGKHCVEGPCAGNNFVPIPYEKSLKITIQGTAHFFHIIYEQYPFKTHIKTFTGQEDLSVLQHCFTHFGEAPLTTTGLEVHKKVTEEIKPLETIPLLKLKNASGIIRIIEMDADGSFEFFQKARIRMRWDGHIRWDVFAPVGIFFGSAVEAEDMRSLPLRVEKLESGRVRLHCYFPMPFWEQAEIELVNLSHEYKGPVDVKFYVSKNRIKQSLGTYFTTLYHEGETVYSHDWLLFEGKGSGWFVGVVQSMQYEHYCEGDEHFYIDGAISPQINGTGTEDYYLACFWRHNVDFNTPFSCVVGDMQKKGGGHWRGAYYIPSCYSRFHLEAPIPFYSSINARIQHGGLSNIKSNYRSLAFCYLNKSQGIHQTDFIDVGNPASEQAHEYQPTNSSSILNVEAHPEGEYFETLIADKGRYHQKGEITFKIAIDPDNDGVRLRRRTDQKIPRQKAQVYIDGKYAGCWYHGYENEYLRWFDLDFEIHPDFTREKSSLNVKLIIETKDQTDAEAFADFSYSVFCYDF